MSFSFGFSGDDIEEDANDTSPITQTPAEAVQYVPSPIPAQTHDLDELLSSLPDKISYSILNVTSPQGLTARLPRRELFDVRLQLMAEDDGTSLTPLAGLDDSDVRPNIYEGGYKTWECSLDLAGHLLDLGPRGDIDRVDHVVEMGCGTALPSLLLFQRALGDRRAVRFTLTDYNADVLRLVTVPNLVLAWAGALGDAGRRDVFGETETETGVGGGEEEHGELYITPAVLQAFTSQVASAGISLTLLSGSWLPTSSLLPLIPSAPEFTTLVLASETIYSPASLRAFTEAMVALMRRVDSARALVAAKRVYFGVGGSVDGFREECARWGGVVGEVGVVGLGGGEGVRRVVVEVVIGWE